MPTAHNTVALTRRIDAHNTSDANARQLALAITGRGWG